MRMRAPWRFAALAVLALAGFGRADVKEVSELLPAKTMAYVEVRQPERLAREVAALLKNSDLDDMAAVMARYRERLGDNGQFWSFYEYGEVGLLLSPEIINECGRVQGAALAVTNVNKDGPEVVFVILSGDSNLPTFYMRGMLSMSTGGHSVGEVEGVRIYRQRTEKFSPPAAPGQPPAPPTWEDSGPYMALTGPAVIIGSSLDGVKDVIRRYKGKSTEPSLGSVAAFKEAARQRDLPGLFAYADVASLAQRLDDMKATLGPFEPVWRSIKKVVNPRAAHGATASLTLVNGALELKARVELDPKETSPLAELVGDKAAAPDALYFTPRDGVLTLNLSLDNGEKRWQKLMDLLDGLARPGPGEAERPMPTDILKAAEARFKLSVAHDILGRLSSAAVVVDPMAALAPRVEQPKPPPGVAPPVATPPAPAVRLPLIVLQATDADAAKYLEGEGLPRLIGLASYLIAGDGQAAAVVHEDVDGRSLSIAASGGLSSPLGSKNLYFGREGAFVVVGGDKKGVAAALNAGAKKDGLLADEKTAAAVKGLEDPDALAVLSVGEGVVELFRLRELTPVAVQPFTVPVPPGVGPNPPAAAPKLSPRAEQTVADVRKVIEPLPPAVFGLSRKPEALTLEARQTGLKGVVNKLVDLWIESGMERVVEQMKGAGG